MPGLGLRGLHLITELSDHTWASIFLLHFQGLGNLWPAVALQRGCEVSMAPHTRHTCPLSHGPCPEVCSKGLAGRWASRACYYWGTKVPQTPPCLRLPRTPENRMLIPGSYKGSSSFQMSSLVPGTRALPINTGELS